ncbi:ChbG/HpnK family deacetylase, partial [Cetobacterium sp.]
MKKKLIVNADDFGLSPGVNKGIIETYLNGILSSTTLMVNQPYAEHAIELYKNYDGLGLGIHLTFDKGKALYGISSLTDSDGNFKKYPLLLKSAKKED